MNDDKTCRQAQDGPASPPREGAGLRLSQFGLWMVIAALFSLAVWAAAAFMLL